MQYRGIIVSVVLKGADGSSQILPEYEVVADERKRTVTCWIPSEEGKEFMISALNQSDSQPVRCCTELDGRSVDHALWRPQELGTISGAYVSEDTIVPFAFARIEVTDEENALSFNALPNLEALGTIRFVVLRCAVEEEGLSYSPNNDEFNLHDIGPIHERTKKGGGHCVSLGHQMQVIPTRTASIRDVDTEDSPYCTFIFRYRPLDMLQAQGIITFTPWEITSGRDVKPTAPNGPGSSSSQGKKRARETGEFVIKREIQDGNANNQLDRGENAIALLAQEQKMKAELKAVREKLANIQQSTSHKRVKREHSPIRLIGKGKRRAEVIDLTLDD